MHTLRFGRKLSLPSTIARASRFGGSSIPRSFAVRRLMTNSNRVGCWTGRSDGFADRIACVGRLQLLAGQSRHRCRCGAYGPGG